MGLLGRIRLDSYYYSLLAQNNQQHNISMLTSMKPILILDIDSTVKVEGVIYPEAPNSKEKNTFFFRKLFNENLIRYKTKEFTITADPIFNFGMGNDFEESKTTWVNSRGLTLTGSLGKTLGEF